MTTNTAPALTSNHELIDTLASPNGRVHVRIFFNAYANAYNLHTTWADSGRDFGWVRMTRTEAAARAWAARIAKRHTR